VCGGSPQEQSRRLEFSAVEFLLDGKVGHARRAQRSSLQRWISFQTDTHCFRSKMREKLLPFDAEAPTDIAQSCISINSVTCIAYIVNLESVRDTNAESGML